MPRKDPADDNVVQMPAPRRRSSPMKGRKQTEAQREATAAGRAKRAERAKQQAKAREAGVPMRSHMLLAGKLTVQELDDEELSRGRCRDRAGGFSGIAPALPHHIVRQMQRELIKRGGDQFSKAYLAAIKTLQGIATDPSEKAADRVKAAALIIERVSGKVPEKVVLADGTWDETFDDIILKTKRAEETG